MSADDISEFYVHTAIVETFQGAGAYGDIFAAPVTLDPGNDNGCFIDDARKLVRSAAGEQIVSESTLYTYPANAGLFTPDTRVTVNGAVSRVIKANLNDSKSLDLPDHLAVSLT